MFLNVFELEKQQKSMVQWERNIVLKWNMLELPPPQKKKKIIWGEYFPFLENNAIENEHYLGKKSFLTVPDYLSWRKMYLNCSHSCATQLWKTDFAGLHADG